MDVRYGESHMIDLFECQRLHDDYISEDLSSLPINDSVCIALFQQNQHINETEFLPKDGRRLKCSHTKNNAFCNASNDARDNDIKRSLKLLCITTLMPYCVLLTEWKHIMLLLSIRNIWKQ